MHKNVARKKINQFAKNNIILRGEKFFDAPRKIEKKYTRKNKRI